MISKYVRMLKFEFMASFGSLLFMYYVPANKKETINYLYLIIILGISSFTISLFAAQIPWVSVLWIGIISLILNYLILHTGFKGPGVFFLLMINGMLPSLGALPFNLHLKLMFYAIVGVILVLLWIAIENQMYEKYPMSLKRFKVDFIRPENNDLVLKALINANFIFIAYYVGFSLHLANYYWVLVGATTILQEETLKPALKKQFD